jgi:DNA ligase (NAD+)
VAGRVGTLKALLALVSAKDEVAGEDEAGKKLKHNPAVGELVAIEGVGATVALSLLDGIGLRAEVVSGLDEVLSITEQEAVVDETGPLTGLTFCITGTLSRPRKEVALRIKAAGGKVVTQVSGKLDHLVAGESAGSKLDKAGRLGVNVLSEEALAELSGVG